MQVTTPWQAVGDPIWWRRTLALGIGLLAAALAGSALVSWVAANWPQMGPQARLTLVQGVLALAVVLAAGLAWRGSRWAGVLTGVAALATGALLALVGQIYQTGADRWQLFLLWAALVTPWLLLARTVFLALLWAVLLNLALWLAVDQGVSFGPWAWLIDSPARDGLWLLGLNGGLLVLAECASRFLRDPWHLTCRGLAVAVLGWAFYVVAMPSLEFRDQFLAPGFFLGLASVAILYVVYGHGRRDLAVAALSLLTGIGQVGALWIQMLDSLDGVLGLAVLLLVLTWLAVRHLLHLRQAALMAGSSSAASASASPSGPIGDDDPDGAAAQDTPPWYLAVLRIGALIPVLLLLGVWVVASFELDSAVDALAAGVLLMCPGLLMDRLARRDVWREIGGVLAVLGLLLCVGSVAFLMDQEADRLSRLLILVAAGGLVYVCSRRFSVRLMAAILVLGAGFWLTSPDVFYFGGDADAQGVGASHLAWRLWVFLAAGSGLWVWSLRAVRRRLWAPLAWALMAMAAGVALLLAQSMPVSVWEWPWFGQLAMVLCALLPGLLLAAWMAVARPALPIGLRTGVPLAVCIAGLGWVGMPAWSVALVWLVLGRLSGGRVLQVLAVPLGLAGLLLYGLDAQAGISLLDKAMILGLTAVWLIGVAGVLAVHRRSGSGSRPTGRGRWLPIGVMAGGVLVLGLAQAQVHRYETILSQGRPVVLALAPVDPRSLMQGDYMALDYAVRKATEDWLHGQGSGKASVLAEGGGWLLLRPDAQGIWQLQGVETAQPPASSSETVALAFRWRDNRPDFGAASWFFPEGQGERFAGARYGVLRVADDGTALLAGLLDAGQQPL